MTKTDERKAINLKISPEVHEAVKAYAKRENRSINNAVETLLMRATETPKEI